MLIAFVQNAALLITLSVLYGIIKWYRIKWHSVGNNYYFQILQGTLFGFIAIAAMMMPHEYSTGIIYDGRSVILTLAGFWGGGYSAVFSVIIAGAYRAYLGGAGMWAGIAIILFCSLSGLLFRQILKSKINELSFLNLWLIGIIAHLVMLASQLLLPDDPFIVIKAIAIPVILVFPLTFAFISKLIQLINRYIHSEQRIRAAESLYRTTLMSIGDAVICTDKDGHVNQMNKVAEELTGWKFTEATKKPLAQVFKIINEYNREAVESPFTKVILTGSIVGLANHTLLVSKDQKEIPIADSGAPIKNEMGETTGVVLVFRDQTEERAYQEEIARSEAKYRDLVESTDAIAWEYDIEQDKWAYVAPQVTEKMGWLPEEWTNLDFWKNNIHPDERENSTNYCLSCAAKGEPHSLEYRFKKKDGSYIWLRDVVSVEMQNNKAITMRGVMFDITERKNIENQVRQREFWLTQSQKAGKIGSYEFDIASNSWTSSEVLDEIFGITKEEKHTTESWNELIHPEQKEEMIAYLFNHVVKGKNPFDKEYKIIRRNDGAVRWVLGRGELNFDKKGNPTIMYGTIMDITPRVVAEKEIIKQKKLFETMFNTISDGVVITNSKREIILANNGMKTTFGYEANELTGKKTEILYADKQYYKETGRSYFNEKAGSNKNVYVTYYKDKDNNIFPGETFGAKLYDNNNEWIGNIGIMRNISDREKLISDLIVAKEKAEESDRLKTAFLANMSHEIRTPINAIMGFSSLLPEEDKRENISQYSGIIVKNSEYLVHLIDDVMLYSKLQTNLLKYNPEQFDINNLLADIVQLFKIKENETGIQFSTKMPINQHFSIKTDYDKLKQLLINLISNAFKYTFKGTITLGVEKAENKLLFYVKDSGIGIPEKEAEKVFDRFYRAGNVQNGSIGGTGLGLSIVKELAALLGGTIWLESKQDEGSTFYFSLETEDQLN